MKALLLTTTLTLIVALSAPASADRWRDGYSGHGIRYGQADRNHRHHDYRYCDDRRHDHHYRQLRHPPGVKVIVKDRRHQGRGQPGEHHHHHHRDHEALKWIAGTLIIREILR